MAFEFASRPPLEQTPHPPLLVLLHGLGADEHDLLGLASGLDPRLHVLSLRAPHETTSGGYAWFPIDFLPDGRRLIGDREALEARDTLMKALASLPSQLGIEP